MGKRGRRRLRKLIAAAGDVRLVILDPLASVSACPLTSVTRVRRELMRPLQTLARDTGCAVLSIHHLTKAGDVAGSRAVVDTARSVLLATRGDDGIRTITVHKSNMARDAADPVRYRIAGTWPDTTAEWIPAEDDPRAGREGGPAQARVLMALRSSSAPRTGQQLAAMTDIPYGSVRVILHKLGRRALVASQSRGLYVARQVPATGPVPAQAEQAQVSALGAVN